MPPSGELSHSTFELVPNLGDMPLDQQRDYLFEFYGSKGLIDTSNPDFITEQPLADIFKMRYTALGDYVGMVKERMRNGSVLRISVDDDSISPSVIFDRIKSSDGQERELLLTRLISRSRLEVAIETGSDRDSSSNMGYHGGEYEEQTMKEYAVTTLEDVTYAKVTRRNSEDIKVPAHSALLVYAPEALQEIRPKSRHIMGSSGFHVFIDPRLKWQSLLGAVESTSPVPQSTIGRLALPVDSRILKLFSSESKSK